jgi:hypothetical protein
MAKRKNGEGPNPISLNPIKWAQGAREDYDAKRAPLVYTATEDTHIINGQALSFNDLAEKLNYILKCHTKHGPITGAKKERDLTFISYNNGKDYTLTLMENLTITRGNLEWGTHQYNKALPFLLPHEQSAPEEKEAKSIREKKHFPSPSIIEGKFLETLKALSMQTVPLGVGLRRFTLGDAVEIPITLQTADAIDKLYAAYNSREKDLENIKKEADQEYKKRYQRLSYHHSYKPDKASHQRNHPLTSEEQAQLATLTTSMESADPQALGEQFTAFKTWLSGIYIGGYHPYYQ